MQTGPKTLWVGRVHDGRARAVRAWTTGDAPGPGQALEEIADPFADPDLDPWVRAHEACVSTTRWRVGEVRLLAPVRARKVIGVGRNYRAHAEELGNEVPQTPLLFLKAPTCLIGTDEPIVRPLGYDRVDMESELVVVIGRAAKQVTRARAWDHVAGYALGNDVSNRDLQAQDKQWTRAKGFDGFGPLGPFVRLAAPGWPLPVETLRIRGYLGDQRVQDASLADMIFDIPTLIETISAGMTLEPGDLIYTGTPAGVAALQPGDRCGVELVGLDLGFLRNPVV